MTIVRPQYFYPAGEHVENITLADFVVTKAATQWAPPTACQDVIIVHAVSGLIGRHMKQE